MAEPTREDANLTYAVEAFSLLSEIDWERVRSAIDRMPESMFANSLESHGVDRETMIGIATDAENVAEGIANFLTGDPNMVSGDGYVNRHYLWDRIDQIEADLGHSLEENPLLTAAHIIDSLSG